MRYAQSDLRALEVQAPRRDRAGVGELRARTGDRDRPAA